MKRTFLFFITFGLVFILNDLSFAVMANPNIIKEEQPDGTEISIRLYGDEFYSWYEDLDGYTIVKDTETNSWSYAQKNNFGELEPSKNLVGKVKPAGLNIRKSLKDDNKLFKATQRRIQFNNKLQKTLPLNVSSTTVNIDKVQKASSVVGKKTNFVLLLEFKDLKFSDNPPFKNSTDDQIVAAFDNLFNKKGYSADGAVGSVKDFFTEASYGKLEYNTVISPIIKLKDQSYREFSWNQPGGEDAAVAKLQAAIRNALDQLDKQGYDFKSLWPNSNKPDVFSVLHAGGGAESGNLDFIWSHQWHIDPITLDNITFEDYQTEPAGRGKNGNLGLIRIGVLCHETVHVFGLPDLYDASYITGGLGEFCLMASGEWNGSDGKLPAHPSAWCKYKLGWISPKRAYEGTNTIGESATEDDAFYKFSPSSFNSKEYFLMENRQSIGFDKGIPGSKKGILIYHIDETQNEEYGNNILRNSHYLVLLEEAGSKTSNWEQFPIVNWEHSGSDSDYFRNDTVSYFSDDCFSSPNSRSYNGTLSGIQISEISSSSSLMSFAYGKEIVIIDDLSKVICYPNPARDGHINIINLPTNNKDFSVEVFTVTSKLVKAFSPDDIEYTYDGFKRIKWDCKNDAGEDVAPGVYLILVKNDSKKKVFKVAVIR